MGMEKIINSENVQIAAEWAKKLTEKSKAIDIVKYLKEYRESENGKKLNERFNKFSKEDKLRLYKEGWQNVGNFFKRTMLWGIGGRVQWAFTYESKTAKIIGPEMSIVYRFLVHMWVLDNPGIVQAKLIEDIKKDAKFTKVSLWIAKVVCTAFAPELDPLVLTLSALSKTLSEKAVEIAEIQHATDTITQDSQAKILQDFKETLPGKVTT